jgi:CheY-like chemotaxis protein
MDAKIWYSPGEPSGSTFHLCLPIAEEHEAVMQARAAAARAAEGARVIAMTPSQAVAATIETYGDVMGLKVIWAPTGRDALNAFQQNSAATLLIDARASDTDQRTLTQAARTPRGRVADTLLLIDDDPAKGQRASAGSIFDKIVSRPFGVDFAATFNAVVRRGEAAGAATGGAEGAASQPAAAECDGRLRILMVEDNAPNRLVASALLKSAGYALDIAEDGIEAVERALKGSYHIILMDVQMPRLDGIGATKQIRACERLKHMPIIGLSASAMKKDRDVCIAAGMTDYLPKPVDWDKLLSILAAIDSDSRKARTNAA